MGAHIQTGSGVWHFRIERPSRRNAIDSKTAVEIAAALREADEDPRCAVALLYGEADWFCAGSDLKELAGQTGARMAQIEHAKAALARTIYEIDLPVIAAVRGFALGGGVSLAAACDHVVSEISAKWHMPEVLNGWIPPWGIQPVIDRCGAVRARNVLLGASAMTAPQARSIGLVDTVCEDGEAITSAEALAEAWASLPPPARRSIKRFLREHHLSTPADADAAASELFVTHCATSAAQATLSRFGVKA
ncbi:enoyl-CoA hydratase/isomerase family protein [Variovorax sp. KBS0712]|uniref:enoyl-CoA hydratase/isomerase family protein n=1 Tax=Variovorax sp. KBS0712 TaxID=2578111 RepID=UPI00111A8B9D|nr:enoyl-CoA hydratase/isomerase family protein [Variovorax sp. KBS0712]TSD57070.1 enoyl-CoA hydratase/isomerase family protein [Variovorax sp. KBS0712]